MNVDLQSRAVKATVVLDPAVGRHRGSQRAGKGHTAHPGWGRAITAEVNAKSLRRCVAVIAENGPDGVAVVLQGKLEANNTRVEAGIAAQPKMPKATPAPAISSAA